MKNSIKISDRKIKKISKSILRDQMLETGFYSRPNHVVFKSEKDYTRKTKYKISYF